MHAFKSRKQQLQRVIGVGGLVKDDVVTQRDMLGLDARQWLNLAGMHDGSIKARFDAGIKKHTVQHLAGGRVDAEAHVGQAHHRECTGDFLFDAANCLDAFNAVATQISATRGEWKRERVKNQIGSRQPITLGGDLVQAMGDLHLPFHIAGLAAFIDQQTNDSSAIVTGKRKDAIHASTGLFAVFEVGAVQDAATTHQLQRCFKHLWFGGVQHEGHTGLAGKATCNFGHVGDTITTDIVDTNVQHVGAFANLFGSHLGAGIPIGGQHCIAECSRAVGVGTFADVQHAVVLFQCDG